MDALFIAVAFALGLLARQIRLPPMVGFLLAGFVLKALGHEAGAGLNLVADLGVTLLLFLISCSTSSQPKASLRESKTCPR